MSNPKRSLCTSDEQQRQLNPFILFSYLLAVFNLLSKNVSITFLLPITLIYSQEQFICCCFGWTASIDQPLTATYRWYFVLVTNVKSSISSSVTSEVDIWSEWGSICGGGKGCQMAANVWQSHRIFEARDVQQMFTVACLSPATLEVSHSHTNQVSEPH